MLVSIHQPHYLPWLRYFEKVARSELFILLDDVDYTRNGWQNRNRIKTRTGAQLMTVPVSAGIRTPINQVAIPSSSWARKHWLTISQSYASAKSFAEIRDSLKCLYESNHICLMELNRAMFEWHLRVLGLSTPWVTSSSLGVTGTATSRLVDLVKAAGGSAYLTGEFAFGEYLVAADFKKADLDLWVFDWKSPTYTQIHSSVGFVPELSTLDLICNSGGQRSREILAQSGAVRRYDG